MLAPMQPESGGRLNARLLDSDAARASYAVELHTASGFWSTSAQVSTAEGEVSWGEWTGPGEPPEWLCRYARAALRGAWRDRENGGWARRLTRWRETPAAGREGGTAD